MLVQAIIGSMYGANPYPHNLVEVLNIYKAKIETNEVAGVFFCGGGGSTDGIVRYTNIPVVGAVNHDLAAIRMHQTNHPFTEHYKEDVFAVDPKEFCGGYPMGFAWFSPDCTHFSRARGATPVKKEIRGLSWVLVKWALSVRPRVMAMENVPEIRTWGPLIERDGKKYPDPARSGETFDGFVKILTTGIEAGHPALLECCEFLHIDPSGEEAKKLIEGLGYKMDWKELCAADYGVHTTRTRFFGIFRCDGKPIVWPKRTHAKRGSPEVLRGEFLPWEPAADILDFSLPAPSIFDTKEDIKAKYSIRAVRPLRDNTMRRITRGLDKFVLKANDPYVVAAPYTCTNTTNSTGSSVVEPLNTVRTGGGGGQMVITPYLAQYHTEQSENVRGQGINEPIMTLDASNRYGVVAPILTKYYGNDNHGQNIEEPLHTVTARDREGLVLAHICKFKGDNIGQHPLDPIQTITATEGGFAVIKTKVAKYSADSDMGHWPQIRNMLNQWAGYNIGDDEVLLKNINGEWYYVMDIGLRMLKAKEAYRAMGFAPDYVFDMDSEGRKMTTSEQMQKCGNAVCPDLAGLITAANLPEYARTKICHSMEEWRSTVAA